MATATRPAAGRGLGLEQTLNDRWSAGASARVWETRYDRLNRDLDPFGQSVQVNLIRRIGLGYLQTGARVAQEITDRENLRWQGWGTSLDYATVLGQKLEPECAGIHR